MIRKKIILYGAGNAVKSYIDLYGKENVEYICDLRKTEGRCYDIELISIEKLKKIHQNYRIIISISNEFIIADAKKKLNELGINCEIAAIDVEFIHIYGKYPNISIENAAEYLHFRSNYTIEMFIEMLDWYRETFIGKEIDYWIYVEDSPARAKLLADVMGVKKVFAYCSTFAVLNNVCAIPDSRFLNSQLGGGINAKYEEAMELCIRNGLNEYQDDRAFWIGNIHMNIIRKELKCLALSENKKINVIAQVYSENKKIIGGYVPMSDWYNYKYLLDAPGVAWTDRTKFLLAMGRVVLYIENHHKEYYWNRLEPMVHYVPIKPDLSDLIQKIDYLNENPDVYRYIVQNATEFVRENFTKERVLGDLFKIVSM